MNSGKFGTGPTEPGGDVWRRTLARVPTLFGRLVYLASLRNAASGAYQHTALAQMLGEEEAGDTLRRSHGRVFQDWLCLNLEQQKSDLQEYLAETANPATLLGQWASSGEYRGWPPPDAQEVEKRLFISDFETMLSLLQREYGAASPGPAS